MLYEKPVVLGRCDAREDQLLTLFGESIEINERPDDCDQQRQAK